LIGIIKKPGLRTYPKLSILCQFFYEKCEFKKSKNWVKRTYPKVSILCWFFHENREFFGNFTKEPGTEDVVLKIL